jgi:hypothetical protein
MRTRFRSVIFLCFFTFSGGVHRERPRKTQHPLDEQRVYTANLGCATYNLTGGVRCVRVSEFFFYFKSHCRYFVKKHTHAAHNHFAPSRQNLRRYNIIIVSEGGFSFEWTYTNIILCCIYIFIACVRYTYSVLQLPPAKNVDQMFV